MAMRTKKGEELFVRVETVMTDLQISRPFAYCVPRTKSAC